MAAKSNRCRLMSMPAPAATTFRLEKANHQPERRRHPNNASMQVSLSLVRAYFKQPGRGGDVLELFGIDATARGPKRLYAARR